MEENKIKNKDTFKKIKIAFAIFLMLLSVILMINVGSIARGLSFVFIYLFGIGAYFIYVAIFILGLSILIKDKLTLFKRPLVNIGMIILLIGFIVLTTGIVTKVNKSVVIDKDFYTTYTNIFFKENNYFKSKFITFFNEPTSYGGGLLGYTLYGLMSLSGKSDLGFIVSIFVVVLGLLIVLVPVLYPMIKNLIKKSKENKKNKTKKVKKEKAIKEEKIKKPLFAFMKKQKKEKVVDENDIKVDRKELERKFYLEASDVNEGDDINEINTNARNSDAIYTPDYNSGVSSTNSQIELFGAFVRPNAHISDNKINQLQKATLNLSDSTQEVKVNEQIKLDFSETNIPSEEEISYQEPIKEINKPVIAPKVEVKVNEPLEKEIENEELPLSLFDNYEDYQIEPDKPNTNQIKELENDSYFKNVKQEDFNYQPIKRETTNKPVVNNTPKKEEKVYKPFKWTPPSLDLLDKYETAESVEINNQYSEQLKIKINKILSDFHIGAHCVGYTIGSSVTRYHIEPDIGVAASTIGKVSNDISRLLGGVSVRFQEVIEGDVYSGLEIPNIKPTMVSFREVVEKLPDVKKHPTAVAFGKNITGDVVKADYAEFPHLLVAGTSGSGKSIYVHSIIATLIMRLSPKQLRIVLVDPKQVEMMKYKEMPHLLTPIITDAEKATVCLNKLVDEMNDRYSKFLDADACSNIKEYNEYAQEHKIQEMPYILIVLDEYADLYDTNKDISRPVASLTQKARAAGIHLLVATQRPSTNVISGVIKANLATRVALMTASATDSITIIGGGGAESLMGKGDMLVNSPLVSRVGYVRLQGCYVSNKEINRIVHYLKDNYETKYEEEYLDLVDHSKDVAMAYVESGDYTANAGDEEEMAYQSTKDWVMTLDSVSISKIQRECGFGFNRSGRFFSRLQKEGIVSLEKDPVSKGCKVLIKEKFGDVDLVKGSISQSYIKK